MHSRCLAAAAASPGRPTLIILLLGAAIPESGGAGFLSAEAPSSAAEEAWEASMEKMLEVKERKFTPDVEYLDKSSLARAALAWPGPLSLAAHGSVQLNATPADVVPAKSFHIGQRVRLRDRSDQNWRIGYVTSVSPLRAMPEGHDDEDLSWAKNKWALVEPLKAAPNGEQVNGRSPAAAVPNVDQMNGKLSAAAVPEGAAPAKSATQEAVHLNAAPVNSTPSNSFHVGQRVRMRDLWDEGWKIGNITSVSPLRALPDGYNRDFSWKLVEAVKDKSADGRTSKAALEAPAAVRESMSKGDAVKRLAGNPAAVGAGKATATSVKSVLATPVDVGESKGKDEAVNSSAAVAATINAGNATLTTVDALREAVVRDSEKRSGTAQGILVNISAEDDLFGISSSSTARGVRVAVQAPHLEVGDLLEALPLPSGDSYEPGDRGQIVSFFRKGDDDMFNVAWLHSGETTSLSSRNWTDCCRWIGRPQGWVEWRRIDEAAVRTLAEGKKQAGGRLRRTLGKMLWWARGKTVGAPWGAQRAGARAIDAATPRTRPWMAKDVGAGAAATPSLSASEGMAWERSADGWETAATEWVARTAAKVRNSEPKGFLTLISGRLHNTSDFSAPDPKVKVSADGEIDYNRAPDGTAFGYPTPANVSVKRMGNVTVPASKILGGRRRRSTTTTMTTTTTSTTTSTTEMKPEPSFPGTAKAPAAATTVRRRRSKRDNAGRAGKVMVWHPSIEPKSYSSVGDEDKWPWEKHSNPSNFTQDFVKVTAMTVDAAMATTAAMGAARDWKYENAGKEPELLNRKFMRKGAHQNILEAGIGTQAAITSSLAGKLAWDAAAHVENMVKQTMHKLESIGNSHQEIMNKVMNDHPPKPPPNTMAPLPTTPPPEPTTTAAGAPSPGPATIGDFWSGPVA